MDSIQIVPNPLLEKAWFNRLTHSNLSPTVQWALSLRFSSMDDDTTLLISPHPPPPPNPNLRPTKSTAFKREERRRRKERKRQEKLADSLFYWDPLSSDQSRRSDQTNSTISVSDTPWPCDPDPPPSNHDFSEWTPFVQPCVPQKPTPLSPLTVTNTEDVQISALKKCKYFFQEEEEEEENGDCTEGEGNDWVLGFFSDLFQSHMGLRRYCNYC